SKLNGGTFVALPGRKPITKCKEAPISDISKILKAADFAADRHRKQRRKGRKKRPYIGHCTEVAALIAEVGEVDDVDVLVAAILHDTLEDTKTEPEELIEMFGKSVNELVLEVTDDKTL